MLGSVDIGKESITVNSNALFSNDPDADYCPVTATVSFLIHPDPEQSLTLVL